MSVQTDPALYNNDFERRENERYFTHPSVTQALLPFIPPYVKQRIVWEPACGRGDITKVLQEEGYDTYSTDIDLSEWDYDLGDPDEGDFMEQKFDMDIVDEYSAIITNPPYGGNLSEAFVRHALALHVDFVAMLLRSEFNSAVSRVDLFDRGQSPFAFELVLTSRPRWDWWYDKKPEEPNHGPRHNFSWLCWDRRWEGPSTQFWPNKEKK